MYISAKFLFKKSRTFWSEKVIFFISKTRFPDNIISSFFFPSTFPQWHRIKVDSIALFANFVGVDLRTRSIFIISQKESLSWPFRRRPQKPSDAGEMS